MVSATDEGEWGRDWRGPDFELFKLGLEPLMVTERLILCLRDGS